MQLVSGGFYETRNGKVFQVFSRDNPDLPKYYEPESIESGYVFLSADMGESWKADGTYFEGDESPLDIVRCLDVESPSDDVYEGPLQTPDATDAILDEVFQERERQEKKWGVQNHGPAAWLPILGEEFGEVARALCEMNAAMKAGNERAYSEHRANYREELVQTAAVCAAMIECLDRNKG